MNDRRAWSVSCAAAALCALAGAASAAEYGTVVSSTPVWTQVSVPQRECIDEQVSVQPRTSGGGALAGALIGGVVGNSIGAGAGRAAATALGAVAGAAVGDHAEANAQPPATRTVQRCRQVSQIEDRLLGYDVVYDYGGMRRTARLPQDPGGPGSQLALDVNVAPSGAAVASRGTTTRGRVGTPVPLQDSRVAPRSDDRVLDDEVAEAPRVVRERVYVEPAPVVVAPYGYPYPVYAPMPSIFIGGVWGGGYGGHHGGYGRRW